MFKYLHITYAILLSPLRHQSNARPHGVAMDSVFSGWQEKKMLTHISNQDAGFFCLYPQLAGAEDVET